MNGKLRRFAGDARQVAEVIFQAATRPRPRLRWRVGLLSLAYAE